MVFGAFHCISAIYAILSTIGCSTNILIVVATIRSKSLHSTANILIAFCAFSDTLHQLGHLPKIIPTFFGEIMISSRACSTLQMIPNFGLNGGIIVLLLIAIDRFLSVHYSFFYESKNTTRYLMCHVIAIIAYAALQYGIAYHFFEERPVFCSPPQMYHGAARELWGVTSVTAIMLSLVLYWAVWSKLRHKASRGNDRRIFRSIFSVVGTIMIGWMLTMGTFTMLRLGLQENDSGVIIADMCGLPANITVCLNCPLLYATSREYRSAFRKQLGLLPMVTKYTQRPNKTITHKVDVSVSSTPPSLRDYSRVMMVAAICDSIGLFAVMGTIASEVLFEGSCFFEFEGLCAWFGLNACTMLFGIQCEMYSSSAMLLCFSFYYRYRLFDNMTAQRIRRMRNTMIPTILLINTPLAIQFYRVMSHGNSRTSLIEEFERSRVSDAQIIGLTYLKDFEGISLLAYCFLSSEVPFLLSFFLRHITLSKSQDLNNMMSQSTQQLHTMLVKVLNIQLVLTGIFFVGCSLFLVQFIFPWLPNTAFLAIPLCNLQNVCTPIANLCIITPYKKYSLALKLK